MILLNELYKQNVKSLRVVKSFVQILAPMAPHICEDLWARMGESSLVSLATWPTYDPNLIIDASVVMGVQVNGKARGTIEIAKDAPEVLAVAAAKELSSVQNALGGKAIDKVIYKAGRILNLIVK